MTEHKVNGHTVIVQDSIDDLSIVRDHKFNVYLMQDANGGSDAQDFHKHLAELKEMIRRDDKQSSLVKADTLYVNLENIIRGLNYKNLALSAMVVSIDGIRFEDTEEGIQKAHERLKQIGATRGWIRRTVEEIKKKIEDDEDLTFGEKLTGQAMSYYERLYQRTEIVLKSVTGIEVDMELWKEIEDFFYVLMKPQKFWGADGIINKYDLAFEKTCIVMNQYLPKDPKRMSVKEFKVALIELNRQNKKR